MVSIVEVTTKAQLRRFVEYPMELYKDVPQYIPGTYDDDLEDWDRKKNPAFECCQASAGWLCGMGDRGLHQRDPEPQRPTKVAFLPAVYPGGLARRLRGVQGSVRHGGGLGPAPSGCTRFTVPWSYGYGPGGHAGEALTATFTIIITIIRIIDSGLPGKVLDWIEELITAPTRRSSSAGAQQVCYQPEAASTRCETRLDCPPLMNSSKLIALFPLLRHGGAVREAQISATPGVCPPRQPPSHLLVMNEAEGSLPGGGAGAEPCRRTGGRIFPTGWVDLLKAFRKNDTVDLLLIAVRPDLNKASTPWSSARVMQVPLRWASLVDRPHAGDESRSRPSGRISPGAA